MSRVAAIDCGTNSIRLLVADVTTASDGAPALRACAAADRTGHAILHTLYQQSLKHDAVAGPQTSRAIHGERTEDGDAHTTTVLGSPRCVNGTDTGRIPAEAPSDTGSRDNCPRRAARPANR